jgi:hypothetical protein
MIIGALSGEALWAGGAVVVASFVAFLGVNLQTARTLKAGRERLDDQLRAEQMRLETQLAHDRATRERGELRGVLDSAVACIYELAFLAAEVISPITSLIEEAGTDKDKALKTYAEDSSRYTKLDEMFTAIRKADGHASQIGIRLGSNHPVCEHHVASRDHFSTLHEKLAEIDVDQMDEVWEALSNAGTEAGEFEFNAFTLVRSDLGDAKTAARQD